MTLGRQLVSAISLMFFAMLMGVELIYLGSARDHLQDQLESHAQDAATSLGLSLGILLRGGDDPIAETVINAMFDRGNYERIEFIALDGKQVVRKALNRPLDHEYPDWFAAVYPLNGPTAESLVSTGWRQLGKVRVTSHPRFAYDQLWNTVRDTLLWLLIIYSIALVVLMLLLRGVLRPLKAIEIAAEAIANRDFVTVDEKPSTRELARVVAAMNSLSIKVRAAFEAETARASSLQEAAYFDPISALLNRRGFSEHFDSRFRYDKESFAGTLALIQVTNLAKINETFGQERGDEMVRSVGKLIGDASRDIDGLAGRWAGAIFAMVIAGQERESAERLLNGVQGEVRALFAEIGVDTDTGVCIGAVYVAAASPELSSLITAADAALQQALQKRAEAPELRSMATEHTASNDDLLASVKHAIASGNVQLVSQPALSISGGAEVHLEIMGRLLDPSGRQLAAAEFIPLVTRHGLSKELDKAVFLRVVQEVLQRSESASLAVNLSAPSIADEEFLDWLDHILTKDLLSKMKLVFEISEHGVLQNEAAAMRFASRISRQGAGFAIDHFGIHRDSLALVRRLNPAYIKLSAVHTPKLVTDMGTRFFVESVTRAAGQLDVPVFAQSVETSDAIPMLQALGLSGFQGFVSGRPLPWPP